MQQETLRATRRTTSGTRASKRLRREGSVPAIVYGTDLDPIAIQVSQRDLYAVLHTEAGSNAIIEVKLENESVLTVAREIYRHPVRGEIDHLDFIEVSLDTEIEADVQIEFVGIPVGVIEDEGIVQTLETSVTIIALPNAIPSSIELDISDLALHDTLTVADLPDVEGVVYVTDVERTIVTVGSRAAEVVKEVELVEGEEGEELAEDGTDDAGDGQDTEDEG